MGAWETAREILKGAQRAVTDRCGECSGQVDVNPVTGICLRCEIEAEVENRRYT